MKRMTLLTLTSTLWLATLAQADTGAETGREAMARAHAERTAQAMRQEGVEHLVPNAAAVGAVAPVRAVAPPSGSTPTAPKALGPSRAEVIAELGRARRAGEMDFAATELGAVSAPIAAFARFAGQPVQPTPPLVRASEPTQLAALPSGASR